MQVAVRLDLDDVLILYTDGITEATDTGGHMLEADGLMDIVRNLAVDLPAPMAAHLLAEMQAFRGNAPREDDQSFSSCANSRDET